MSNKISFFFNIIIIFLLSFVCLHSEELKIIPLKKPILSKEVIEKKITQNIIKPKKKPKKQKLSKKELTPQEKPKKKITEKEKTKLDDNMSNIRMKLKTYQIPFYKIGWRRFKQLVS